MTDLLKQFKEDIAICEEQFKQQQLQESSRSRIVEHISKHDCGMITGFRGWIYPEGAEHKETNRVELSKSQNKARNLQLLGFLQNRGYSVTSVKGGYIEDFGTDNAKVVTENSFFVVDINDKGRLQKDLQELGEKFFQDSVLFIPKAKEDSINAFLIGTSPRSDAEDLWPQKGSIEKVGSFRSHKREDLYQFFTAIGNTPFRFESITHEVTYEKPTFFSRGFSAFSAMNIKSVEEFVESNPDKFNWLGEDDHEEFRNWKQKFFTESSLGRLWQHMENPETVLGVISAYRNERTLRQNQKLTQDLKAKIRQAGFGFIMLVGHWPETREDGSKVDVQEESFAVIGDDENKLDKFLRQMAQELSQEGFLIKPQDTNHIFFSTADGTRSDIGTYQPDRMGDMYSNLRKGSHANRSFVFESCFLHKNWISAQKK